MKELEAMSINYEGLTSVQAGNLNYTMRKNLSYNKGTYPSRMDLTKNELEVRVIDEDFLANYGY